MRVFSALLASVLGLCLVLPASADEVLEAARKEKARREAAAQKKGTASGKKTTAPSVVSNKNLKKAAGEGPSRLSQESASGVAGNGKKVASGDAGASDAAKTDGAAAADKPGESYWRGRMEDANHGITMAQKDVQDLNEKINSLRRESTSIDDYNVRMSKTQQLLEAEGQLPAAQRKVVEAEKAVEAVRDEGRRAGAPAGWLR